MHTLVSKKQEFEPIWDKDPCLPKSLTVLTNLTRPLSGLSPKTDKLPRQCPPIA